MTFALIVLGLAIIAVLGLILIIPKRLSGQKFRHHRRSDRIERGPHHHQREEAVDTDRSLRRSHRAPSGGRE